MTQFLSHLLIAEAVRFELTVPCGTPVFKTGALNHYATPPCARRIALFLIILYSDIISTGGLAWINRKCHFSFTRVGMSLYVSATGVCEELHTSNVCVPRLLPPLQSWREVRASRLEISNEWCTKKAAYLDRPLYSLDYGLFFFNYFHLVLS